MIVSNLVFQVLSFYIYLGTIVTTKNDVNVEIKNSTDDK